MPDPVRVVHLDERLVAVDKPAGQTALGPGSIHEQLAAELDQRIFVVHRLDAATSGLLLFARDAETHRYVSGLFEARQVDKGYLAAVISHMERESGEVDLPIREFGSGRMGVDMRRGRGKASQTRYRVLERLDEADLLEVHPLTGRRHQIRVHLHAIGHAILGDDRYGTDRPVGGEPRLLLHARELAFTDANGGAIRLSTEPPSEFSERVALRR